MVGYEQERALMSEAIQMLEAIHVHQFVSRNLNPTRTDTSLAPRPELLPTPLIHTMRDAESEAFHDTQHS